MRNNDLVVFIDSKGVSHNALVKAFREHFDEKGVLVDTEPLVTLTYNLPTGEPKEVIDVHHMDHPIKQEPNPDLPTYALHVWKYQHEDHLPVPSDHPLHDHPYELQKMDAAGVPIPKRRPQYEMHIHLHKLSKRESANFSRMNVNGGALPGPHGDDPVTTVDEFSLPQRSPASAMPYEKCPVDGTFLQKDGNDDKPYCPICRAKENAVPVNHPAHPETIHFEHKCVSCGIPVHRVASHQGGKEWDKVALTLGNTTHDFLPGDKEWQEHVCKQADIEAFRESLKPNREPEMTELQKAALEPAGEPPKPEKTFDAVIARDRQLLSEIDEHV